MKTASPFMKALRRWYDCSREVRMALLPSVIVFSLLFFFVNPGYADYYHDLQMNRQPCSDCHTMHYSEDGKQPVNAEAGGPFSDLLLRSTTNKLCLFCHDGSDPAAPDVMNPVTMYIGSGDEHSGAGYFTYQLLATDSTPSYPNGHYLGGPAVNPPFSTSAVRAMSLSCASCHDPHGTPYYRNTLMMDKVPSSLEPGYTGTTVFMAQDVFRNLLPSDPPSTQGSINAYKRSNEGYKAKTSLWCTGCHDQLKDHVSGNTPATRLHHLCDDSLNSYGTPTTEPDYWSAGTGTGFGATTGDAVEGIPRLRFQAAGAADLSSSQTVSTGNQVMCMSCHLAHGWRYQYGLSWPYEEGGADANSGCNQCHNK